jgi:hypothetical protein
MGTGKRQSILGKFPNISEKGANEKKLKEEAKKHGLQARGVGGEHSAMDAQGTADISPMARFGVTEAFVAEKLYNGLVKLYQVEKAAGADHHSECVFIEDARKQYLDGEGNVAWDKVEARWLELRSIKTSLGNKFFTKEASQKARGLEQS